MRIKIVSMLVLLSCSVANAQSLVNEVFKTIVPETERAYYNFLSIDEQSKILAYGNGVSKVYDEKWNVLESHDAGQEELNTGYFYLSRSYQYDSKKKHTLQPHGKNQTIPINLRNIHIIFGLIIITNSIMERLKLYII